MSDADIHCASHSQRRFPRDYFGKPENFPQGRRIEGLSGLERPGPVIAPLMVFDIEAGLAQLLPGSSDAPMSALEGVGTSRYH